MNNSNINITNLRTQNLVNPLGIQAVKPVFGWLLTSDEKNKFQSAYQIIAASSTNKLNAKDFDLWDSGKVTNPHNYGIVYSGKDLTSMQQVYWTVRIWDENDNPTEFSAAASFEIGLLDENDWTGKWITYEDTNLSEISAAPIFSKEFTINPQKTVSFARLYISGLGIYEAHINGEALNANTYFNPGESDVRKTVYYNTYDIKNFLNTSDEINNNAIAFILGNGQYANYRIHRQSGRYYKTDDSRDEAMIKGMFGKVKAIAQIVIGYTDGTTDIIGTDDTWSYIESPITQNSWYGGEDYDATMEIEGWNDINPKISRKHWKKAILVENMDIPYGKLTGVEFPPITIQKDDTISSSNITVKYIKTENSFSTYLVDMGRNGAGFPEITINTAVSGNIITMYPAEVDTFDGYNGHINQASCTQSASINGELIYDTYITKGTGNETYHPRFCYHGYRYLEVVIPSDIQLTKENFKGYILRTDNIKNGSFSSSNEVLNQINVLTERSIESNMYSTFTDCPQIEKLGWLETPSLMFYSMAHTYDISSWIPKIVTDMVDAQYGNGKIAAIAPEYFQIGPLSEDLNWNGSIITTTWQYYETYGNPNIFSPEIYNAMNNYMDYLKNNVAQDNMILTGQMGEWGEMTSYGTTPIVLVETAAYYKMAVCMSKIANVLDRKMDYNKYLTLAKAIKNAFHKNEICYNEKNLYGNGTQSGYGIVLYSGIVLEENVSDTIRKLVQSVEKVDYHLTSGEVGLKQVFSALAEHGRSDVIYKMVTNNSMPSYKYFLDKGLTTLPEYWNFEDLWGTVTRSRNHAMMGHVKEWFTRYLTGISPTNVGYDTIDIKPAYIDEVSTMHGTIDSVHGLISCTLAYEKTANILSINIDIPVGVKATVYVPAINNDWTISIDGIDTNAELIDDGSYLKITKSIGSGTYLIEAK